MCPLCCEATTAAEILAHRGACADCARPVEAMASGPLVALLVALTIDVCGDAPSDATVRRWGEVQREVSRRFDR
jgi:hypothetical protein